jgi:hypothetical protein
MWEALLGITGSLLFACQSAPATGDLYFKDDAGVVHQLTVTEPSQGASDAVWDGQSLVAVVDRGFRNGIERRELTTRPATAGKRVGEGVSPAVSSRGTLAYVSIRGETKGGRMVDEVIRVRRGRRTVLWQRDSVQQLYWVGGRLFAWGETRSGRDDLVEINRHPRRSISLGKRGGPVAVSSQGRVAYTFGRRGHYRFAVMRLDGSHRRVFRRDWFPLTWSPDGGRILVGNRSRIGVMTPRTGNVRRLGKLDCGYVTSAVWTAKGTHPWPGDPR